MREMIVKLTCVGALIAGLCGAVPAQTLAPTRRPAIKIGDQPATGPGAAGVGAGFFAGPSTGSSARFTSIPKPVAAAGPSSTFVCRMGGNMVWTLINQLEVVQTQINGKNVRVPIVVALFDQLKFARALTPVSRNAANLQPGYCGLTDRVMTASDPDTVVADADGFTFQETVLWGNGSTIKGATTMSGGSLSFQNKQAFTMEVVLWNGVQWKVVPGTKPKAIK